MKQNFFVYLFEAKGIQRYILSCGKMKDLVGASDLIAKLASSDGACVDTKDLVQICLDSIEATASDYRIARRAGGCFVIIWEQKELLVRFRRQFRLLVMLSLPGLEFSDAMTCAEDEEAAIAGVYEAAAGFRENGPASLMAIGKPIHEIVRRTGRPALLRDGSDIANEEIDQINEPIRVWANALQTRMNDANGTIPNLPPMDGVARRFHYGHNPPSQHERINSFSYPRQLQEEADRSQSKFDLFPWIDGEKDRRLAIVHADISGLGEAYSGAVVKAAEARLKAAEARLKLANEIESAIVSAVVSANEEILRSNARQETTGTNTIYVVPARPIVVGGDDITVIVRADLALPFAACLLKEIKNKTKGIAGGLSACAGIAISDRSSPFLSLNELAESLCSFAKKEAKKGTKKGPYPSMLAFHVQSKDAPENYASDIYPSLIVGENECLTGNPYCIDADGKKPSGWDKLMNLATAISNLEGAQNTLRQVQTAIASGNALEAEALLRRMKTRKGDGRAEKVKAIKDTLCIDDLKRSEIFKSVGPSIFDALKLLQLGTKIPDASIQGGSKIQIGGAL